MTSTDTPANKLITAGFGLILTVTLILMGWTFQKASANEDLMTAVKLDVARIQANRFTAANGLDVWKEIAAIKESMATIPREVPPAWFVLRIDKLEERLERIERAINKGAP